METAVNRAGAWVNEQRTVRNLSLRELARLIGIDRTTLSDAEKGNASAQTWKKIAEYFKTPTDVVLTWAGFLETLPAKDEIILQINHDLEQMDPAGRKLAQSMIRTLLETHKA